MANYYWVVWLLTVISWILVPIINHVLSRRRDTLSEFNSSLVELKSIFGDMNTTGKAYFSSVDFPIESFYEMISHNERMKSSLKKMSTLNNSYQYPENLVTQIRKLTTDDTTREQEKIHALRKLIAMQTRIIEATPTSSNWF